MCKMLKQLGGLRSIEIIGGVKHGPYIAKCRCGVYRDIDVVNERFIVRGCSMYGLRHHPEKFWDAIGTGKSFDFEDEKEKNRQLVEW